LLTLKLSDLADKFKKAKRSQIMSLIKSSETKPERILRSALFKKGLRYRKNVKDLPGTPDIVLKKYGTVIFVNGCFWHGHSGCSAAKMPLTNSIFWSNKIASNVSRDKKNIKTLRRRGWKVVTVWQCQMKTKLKLEHTVSKIIRKLV
jgi:DNA mismatch endonuclease, patch repair protein